MSWVLLVLAGLLEVAWAVGLKYSQGFTKPLPTALTLVALVASLWLLALAMKTLPLGTSYAVWTGIGSVDTVILGIFLFGDSANVMRLLCVGLILAGIFGLKLTS
ncbi:quaternary ammonium compound efflux SMR transporter SugE [soil metagenome]